jgi:hypothetical protein
MKLPLKTTLEIERRQTTSKHWEMKVKRRIQAKTPRLKNKKTAKSRTPAEPKKQQRKWRNPSPLQGTRRLKASRRGRSRQEMN